MTQPARYMNQWQICIGPLIQTKIVWFTPEKRLMNVVKKWGDSLPKNMLSNKYETAMNNYTDENWDTGYLVCKADRGMVRPSKPLNKFDG